MGRKEDAVKVLVTGGGGFLGQAIIKQLLAKDYEVVTLNRSHYPDLSLQGVHCLLGNIAHKGDVLKAAQGCDAIIHTAAKAGVWGPYQEYYAINVLGTRHVIEACHELGITKLVYTSSPSVVFAGMDQEGIDESTPYPAEFLAPYPQTKAEAEKLVLSSQSERLNVVSLRPHLIWGPGDNHLAPRLIEAKKTGKLKFIGKSDPIIDAVYIDNAAQAHLLALERLAPDAPINGKAYFISNDQPWPTERVINSILASAGCSPVNSHVPAKLAYGLGAALEYIYTFFKITKEPPMTRFVAKQLATSHWFSQDRAKRDLAYVPKISMEEGMSVLKEYYKK